MSINAVPSGTHKRGARTTLSLTLSSSVQSPPPLTAIAVRRRRAWFHSTTPSLSKFADKFIVYRSGAACVLMLVLL
ncbi:hypothetical protein VNO78_34108 [Psophocarpus tetragonolobus]|uniref:Uncharacterized protein n=1 Tax=Psophocarpus tetragonolobus TaxID=3891 RepID=A0AAN9P4W6_PSOTE